MVRTAGVNWRAWAEWSAGALVLVLLAGWIWWEKSGTPERWRYEEAVQTFCGGLPAHEKSAQFEGLRTGTNLSSDTTLGPDAYSCRLGVAPAEVTVARLGAGKYETLDLERVLPHFSGSLSPVPLTGGWRGAIDGGSVRVLVDCRDSEDRVAVTVGSYLNETGHEETEARQASEDGWLDSDLFWARFAVATAVKAAAKWDCDAEAGKPLRALPPTVVEPEPVAGADGTCAGLPFSRDKRLEEMEETRVGGGSVYETCRVIASDYFDAPYVFTARFGPDVLLGRNVADVNTEAAAGVGVHGAWASAECPGDAERARFTAIVPLEAATVWLPGEKGEETFGLPAFREFAERSAERHGCTDLRLPSERRLPSAR
ncbi:hypothetical protein ACFT9I_10065 [Streptomyces sp. NPDC057137]|uniref:hypothetical protein n=1 Tax=Streptomyces sp. NPDC057137 TaxID=3346030 RepID=UPI003627335E